MSKQLQDAYIVAATRTPIGKAPRGFFNKTRPDDLLVHAIRGAMAAVPNLDPALIVDAIVGCSFPEAEQGFNVARNAVVLAGLPNTVGGVTVNRYCASGITALAMAADRRDLLNPITTAPGYLKVEAAYAAAAEGALHLEDILSRRTRIAIEYPHRGVDCAREVADVVASVLGWTAADVDREVETYIARVEAEVLSQAQPDDETCGCRDQHRRGQSDKDETDTAQKCDGRPDHRSHSEADSEVDSSGERAAQWPPETEASGGEPGRAAHILRRRGRDHGPASSADTAPPHRGAAEVDVLVAGAERGVEVADAGAVGGLVPHQDLPGAGWARRFPGPEHRPVPVVSPQVEDVVA